MNLKISATFAVLLTTAGCAGSDANTEFRRGRAALLSGMPSAAIAHLERATANGATITYSPLREGSWSYLGRAYYEAMRYPEARQAFERALAVNEDDNLARFYLGLTLSRQGGHESSRREVTLALKGLQANLDYIRYNTTAGIYWDPSGSLRKEVASAEQEVIAANPHLEQSLARLEGLGAAIEREIDLARRDEQRANRRRSRD
jgi:tetratricopeptide (TPR) repeat protein